MILFLVFELCAQDKSERTGDLNNLKKIVSQYERGHVRVKVRTWMDFRAGNL